MSLTSTRLAFKGADVKTTWRLAGLVAPAAEERPAEGRFGRLLVFRAGGAGAGGSANTGGMGRMAAGAAGTRRAPAEALWRLDGGL